MRITIIGSDYEWSIERIFSRELALYDIKVDIIPVQNWFNEFYYSSWIHKIIYRLGLDVIIKKINIRACTLIEEYKPQVIWIFKGMEITTETLDLWRREGYVLINFNPDNPYVFTGRGRGNYNVTKSVALYHVYLTYDHEIVDLLMRNGVNSRLFHFAFESKLKFESLNVFPIRKFAFVGNPDKGRVSFLNQLSVLGVPLDVYGKNWGKYKLGDNIRVFDSVNKEEFIRISQQYLALINIMRIHNPDSHNMRTFEIPGYRGIQVAPATRDHADFFKDNHDIFLYSEPKDVLEIFRKLCSLTNKEIIEIRNRAHTKVVDNYSYSNRTDEFLTIVKELVN